MSSKALNSEEFALRNLPGEERPASTDRMAKRPFQPTPEIQALLEQVKVIGNDLDDLTRETVAAVRSVRE